MLIIMVVPVIHFSYSRNDPLVGNDWEYKHQCSCDVVSNIKFIYSNADVTFPYQALIADDVIHCRVLPFRTQNLHWLVHGYFLTTFANHTIKIKEQMGKKLKWKWNSVLITCISPVPNYGAGASRNGFRDLRTPPLHHEFQQRSSRSKMPTRIQTATR